MKWKGALTDPDNKEILYKRTLGSTPGPVFAGDLAAHRLPEYF